MDLTDLLNGNLPELPATAGEKLEKELETDRGWEDIEEATLETLTEDWLQSR